MRFVDTFVVGDELRARVQSLAARTGASQVCFEQGWGAVVAQFDLDPALASERSSSTGTAFIGGAPSAVPTGPVLAVGSPAFVLRYARRGHDEFGFVTPDAHILRRWQRGRRRRDDVTLQLWHQGWSILSVDRVRVPIHGAEMEFAVGAARPTP